MKYDNDISLALLQPLTSVLKCSAFCSSAESSSSESESSTDEEYGEERDQFTAQLYKFHEERGFLYILHYRNLKYVGFHQDCVFVFQNKFEIVRVFQNKFKIVRESDQYEEKSNEPNIC